MNAKKTVDKVAAAMGDESRVIEEPGALRSQASVTIHTSKAQMMLHGRRGSTETNTYPIIGLTRFGATVRTIWSASRADDPYADLWLLRIEEILDATHNELTGQERQVRSLLERRPDVQIGVGCSNSPVTFPLTFANPYGFQGAYLLSDFDELARFILTAKHVALIKPKEAERLLAKAFRSMRAAYESCGGYRHFGITRDDVLQKTARGQQAIEAMGELPDDVLQGERRAQFAPERSEIRPRRAAGVKKAVVK